MEKKIAFRVFGNFDWKGNAERVPGKFEFYYAKYQTEYQAAIEWIPDAYVGSRQEPDNELGGLGDSALKDLEAGEYFNYWLRGRLPDLDGFEITGAQVLEQVADNERLNLRLLLADRFTYGKGKGSSAVFFGQSSDRPETEGGHTFGFQMAFPTPTPHGMIDGVPVYVFPLRVRYDAVIEEKDDLHRLNVAELAAGLDGTASECGWINQRLKVNTAKLYSSVLNQKCTILGQFGISRAEGSGRNKYAYFPRGKEITTNRTGALWLTDKDQYFDSTLKSFANLDGEVKSLLLLSAQEIDNGAEGELYDSVLPTRNSEQSKVYFRSSFCSEYSMSGISKGDIRKKRTVAGDRFFRYVSPFEIDEESGLALDSGTNSGSVDGEFSWLAVDQVVSIQLSDSDLVLLRQGATLKGTIERTLPFFPIESDGRIEATEFLKPSWRDKGDLKVKYLFQRALCSFRLPRIAIANNEAGDPVNSLPDAYIENLHKVRFALHGEVGFTYKSGDEISEHKVTLERGQWKKFPFHLVVFRPQDERALEALEKPDVTAGSFSFSLPGLEATSQGSPLTFFKAQIRPPETYNEDDELVVALKAEPAESKSTFAGRIAGLQFGAVDGATTKFLSGKWSFRPAVFIEGPVSGVKRITRFAANDTDFQIILGVDRIEPIGVDRPRQSRTVDEIPLLLPIGEHDTGNANGTTDSLFQVLLHEDIRRDSDRRFTADVYDIDSSTASRRPYVVLSRQPFSITKLTMEPLQRRGDEGNSKVATYDSDTRTWQFDTVDRRFHYCLPPQGIGESMDKPGWLELVDSKFDDEVADDQKSENRRPFALVPKDANEQQPWPALRRRVVDYRLTSPAHLWVEPSDLERNFVVPEWATNELFRQRGDFGVGVRLAGLRAEWIYGLAASIDPAKESGPARGARVAEIEMLLGQFPAHQEASTLSNAQKRWNRLRHVITHRPERLEMWMPNPALDRAFDPARFAGGVRFALRDHAQFRYPFPLRDTDTGSEGENVLGKEHPNVSRHGLAGGAIWGMESSAFVREFLKHPDSTGGSIERIALSPHGGDADFRAEFLNGVLAIVAEIRGGRVQRQRIEILGRIGVFWNRARHVVIYERTTSPSAQFTPQGGLGQRTRRPAIRKVEEFIELLQPERSFPDTANADPITTGFLKATRFNSKVIHVDSAWSEDVGNDGWKIPLWNRLSAKQRPSVYPQPDIAFILHSEGEESEPVTAQECLDPENLFFYSDAKAATSDTDQWPPVLGVDWTNLPPPGHAQQQSVDDRVSNEHPRQASAQRFPRGQRRFTWRLAPSARRAKLNHGREGKPIYAALDTLTFSRATADVNSAEVQKFDTAMKSVSEALRKDRFSPIAQEMAEFQKAVERHKGETGKPDDPDNARILTAAKNLKKSLEDASYGNLLGTENDEEFREFWQLVKTAMRSPAKCQKMVDDYIGGIQRKRLVFVANLNEWKADAKAITEELKNIAERDDWIDQATELTREAFTPGLEGARADLGNARAQVEQARAIVTDMAADVRSRMVRAQRELNEADEAYQDHIDSWSPARLEDCQRQLEGARAGLVADLEAALADVRQRLSTETSGLAQKLGRATASAIDAAARAEGGILAQLGQTENAMLAVVNDAQEKAQVKVNILFEHLGKAAKEVSEIDDDQLKDAIAQELAKAKSEIRLASMQLSQRCDQLRSDIHRGRTDLASVIRAVTRLFTDASQAFGAKIAAALTALGEAIVKASTIPAGALKDQIVKSISDSRATTDNLSAVLNEIFAEVKNWADGPKRYIERLETKLKNALAALDALIGSGVKAIDEDAKDIAKNLKTLEEQLQVENVLPRIERLVIRPAFDIVVPVQSFDKWKTEPVEVGVALDNIVDKIDQQLQQADGALQRELVSLQAMATEACKDLEAGITGIKEALKGAAEAVEGELKTFAERFDTANIANALQDAKKLHELLDSANRDFGSLQQQAKDVVGQYDSYADRVFEEAGNIGKGGLAAAPNNVLRLWAAAASAPEMPNLDYTRERLGYYYRELNNVIDTTPAAAFFARLGSELKAIGITLPFEQFDRKMVMLDPSKYDIGSVLNRFCGMDWSKMFKGLKLPAGARDAIRLTHDLDKKSFRAWAQVDIDLLMPGRRSLFTVGPFKLDFVDMHLLGQVRLEASKDTDRVAQSGHAQLVTTIDAVVSGQSMVQLRNVVLEFDKHGKLDVQIDPMSIKINPALEFVQEALTELFPDEIGGMQVITNNGMPIGVEHVYSMPPMSIMGVTSGISNLAISNRFALLAYPDFVIANRFALSRPDMPFLFTIFVIGGSGYILVDAEYRPFNDELAVTVEAAAGGSAALGFALGPVSGSVYVSLSVALSYRKLIGRRGGGLTLSVLLVISGNVDVAGLARVNLTLVMRMYYREGGQIDGLGTLSISLRVTRWYRYRYRKNYQKTLRKGRSSNQPTSLRRDKSNAARMMEARQ